MLKLCIKCRVYKREIKFTNSNICTDCNSINDNVIDILDDMIDDLEDKDSYYLSDLDKLKKIANSF